MSFTKFKLIFGGIMKKRVLMSALALTFGLALTACGNANNAGSDKAADSGSKAGTAAASADGDVFTIGTTGPITGSAASYGNSVKNGATIAIDEINAAGGVKVGDKTYKLALNFQDDEAKEDKAVNAYNSLMDSGINVFMGAVTSGSSLALTDLTAKDNILQITPSGSAKAITENPNVFRLCFTDPLQGKMIADFIVDQGYESVAVLYNNSDEYSTGVYESFKEELSKGGKGELLVEEQSFADGDVDFTTQLTKIKASGAKAIFVPGYYEAAAYIVQQAKQQGIEAAFVGSDGWDGVLSQVTDKSTVEGAVFLSPFLATAPTAADFTSKYESDYKSTPDQFAADGYDTVYVIKAAMEKAGSIESDDLIKAMTEIEVDGITGKVSFNADGEPNKEPMFVTIKNGEYKLFE